MIIRDLLAEYELEIDDVRWYLCALTAERLLALRERRHDLIRYIWSGTLADELYDLEERFLAELETSLDGGRADETALRETMKEIVLHRTRRYGFDPDGGEISAHRPEED